MLANQQVVLSDQSALDERIYGFGGVDVGTVLSGILVLVMVHTEVLRIDHADLVVCRAAVRDDERRRIIPFLD